MAGARQKKHLVFISHSGVDTWVAKQIAREIANTKAIPFLDEATIEVGADFEEEIRDFIEQADELVVRFLTRGSPEETASKLLAEPAITA